MKTTVLLLPGMLNDASLWDAVAAPLAAVADVRRVPTLTQASVPAMADVAWQRLADLPADAPVVLAGFSLGGYVAIDMLARPQRALQAAVLVSTSARPESPESQAAREKTIAGLRKNFARMVEGIAGFVSHQPDTPARITPMMLAVGMETAIGQNQAISQRHDHRAALGKLALPVAVLCGEQDRVTPPELSRELAALIPQATLRLVDDCGHMLPIEQPAAVVQAIHDAVERSRQH
ncbi:alpha/beta fold hydrolase [Hydrogenophaga sp. BPS33]|uniref:alpha/beta fold hydrolase n=1 Tax=Hydrogenophaga sp. BPS33 TaxID=2651974 RepID=UPI0013201ED0|nr:alpha/beta fold hydrolase [Hydrogenophaga sp. BPS33]QHE87398.1 alpha/beta fold hydrolase [Hydrogenophaga sp. BPS33]